MRTRTSLLLIVVPLMLAVLGRAQQRFLAESSSTTSTAHTNALQDLVNDAARTALTKFADKKLTEAQLSITLIDLRDAQHPVTAVSVATSGCIQPAW